MDAHERLLELHRALQRGEADGHPASQRLSRECAEAAGRGLAGTWWRGCRFPPDATPTMDDLAPSKRTWDEPTRFARQGEPALYLAADLSTVAHEVRPETDRPLLFAQRYNLDLHALPVVRLPAIGKEATLLGALLGTSHEIEGSEGEDEAWRLCQHVRAIAQAQGAEAIVWPSVPDGGARDPAAMNAVLLTEPAITQALARGVGDPLHV